MTVPCPICARGWTSAVAIDLGAVRHHAEQQLGLGHDLIADVGGGLSARQRRAAPAERNLQAQHVARDDLAPELGVVDAAEIDAGIGRRVLTVQQQDGRDLRPRFEHQDGRHERRARKVALEEFLVDGDVLDGDQPAAGLVLGDRVNQRGRIPVAQAVEEGVDVDHGREGS